MGTATGPPYLCRGPNSERLPLAFAARINDVVLDIYEGVSHAPFATFRETCLQRVRALIPFDAAIWGSGAEEPQLIFGIAACDFPPERLMEYGARWQAHDVLRSAVSHRPGQCLRNEDVHSLEDHYASEIYREFCGPSGIEHALGVTQIDPVTNVGELIFLFRSDRRAVFRDDERDALELIMPHLAAAWRHRLLWHVARQAPGEGATAQALAQGHAVIDALGQVHASDAAFGLRMRALFPDWIGPRLPDELRRVLQQGASQIRVRGQGFLLHRGQDRHILSLAAEIETPLLSSAERRVALLFATGLTAARVAADLGVSPATVRNHLSSIYAKLGVHSKVELVRKLREFIPG